MESIILFNAHINFRLYFDVFQVQSRFEVDIKELPEQIDTSTYSKITSLHFLNLAHISFAFLYLVHLACWILEAFQALL